MNICDLPDDILYLIFQYIPTHQLTLLNSEYYALHHNAVKRRISRYEQYLRTMMRRDNDYVFQTIVRENADDWIENRQYRYKNMTFSNYIYFVLHFCMEANAEKCIKTIMEELSKRDLCRNLHKKKVVKYIKWNI